MSEQNCAIAKVTEGYMPFGDFNVYWRTVGERTKKLPLLIVHGGPGAAYNYLTSLDDLVKNGRQVIYYDQCGCGKSIAKSAASLSSAIEPESWSLEFFVKELQAVCEYLDLDRFHMLGHSWGGILAICFASNKPKNLTGLVLASSPVSITQWNDEISRLLLAMPDGPRYALEQGRASGKRNTRAYYEAIIQFYQRHMCRLNNIPDFVLESWSQMDGSYSALKGENEFKLEGTLKNVDLTDLLPDINVPTLITAGKFDQCTPNIVKTLLNGIANSRALILEHSGHLAHVEEREIFNNSVETFLTKFESKS